MASPYRKLLLGAAALFLAGAARAEPPPLALYAGGPAIAHVSMAPDGHAVAFTESKDGKLFLDVLPTGQGGPQRVETRGMDIRDLSWIDADRLLILQSTVISDPPILPEQRVIQAVIVNTRTGSSQLVLGKSEGVLPMVAGGDVQYGKYGRRPTLFLTGLTTGLSFGLFAADPDTGRGTALGQGSWNAEGWVMTNDGYVLASKAFDPKEHHSFLTVFDQSNAPHLVHLPDAARPFRLYGLGRTDETVALTSSGDLLEVSSSDGQVSAPLQPAGARVAQVFHNPITNRLVAAQLDADTPAYVFFDEALHTAWDKARAPFGAATVELVSFNTDYSNLVLWTHGPKSVGAYYWVDLRTGRAELIGDTNPALTGDRLSDTRPISFSALDDAKTTGFLSTPPGREAKDLPAVVLVHDGPTGRDDGDFDPVVEAMVSRGYAVIRVNYRGSTGNPVKARGEWGARMQTDLSDAVDYLSEQGVINRRRVCIAGEGYGGYAALTGVTLQHDIYRCAIAIDPIANLQVAARAPDPETRGPRWDQQAVWRPLLPANGEDAELLSFRSPLTHAREASAPILMIQSADKDSLKSSDAQAMKTALDRARLPSQLMVLDAKTQDPDQPSGRLPMLQAMLDFLDRENPAGPAGDEQAEQSR
jgi:dipeptidyl aminopeptidase/acylaminoacyl peptidase